MLYENLTSHQNEILLIVGAHQELKLHPPERGREEVVKRSERGREEVVEEVVKRSGEND